jgi:hypothetical protein
MFDTASDTVDSSDEFTAGIYGLGECSGIGY